MSNQYIECKECNIYISNNKLKNKILFNNIFCYNCNYISINNIICDCGHVACSNCKIKYPCEHIICNICHEHNCITNLNARHYDNNKFIKNKYNEYCINKENYLVIAEYNKMYKDIMVHFNDFNILNDIF
jgi:hypothetical protein